MRPTPRSAFIPLALVLVAGATAVAADGKGRSPDAAMLQYPDVSATDIVFLYANDLWLVSREGGVARPVASPAGREMFPKFSPDGQSIAFVGNYEGNRDVYTISLAGGLSTRVTHHPASEVVTDWSPDGRVLYYASGQNGLARQESVFLAKPEGGMPERLPVPYGTTATISPDGAMLAYTTHTHDFRTWKRYRGGWATDIWLFNLKDRTSRKVTEWEGTDTTPMWAPADSTTLYYLCDDGASHRANIWSVSTRSGERQQITDFTDYDVKWPSIGPGKNGRGEIVFQNGPDLYLLDLSNSKTRKVQVTIPGDHPTLRDQMTDFSKVLMGFDLSPSGKRVVVSAHGDLWSLPAEQGVMRRLTSTAGIAERDGSVSPDGKRIAFLSDQTGEYELYLTDLEGKNAPVRLTETSGSGGFKYIKSWSPDSKHILFTDKTGAFFLHTLGGKDHDGAEPGATKQIAKELWSNQTPAAWSHDSAWIAITLGHENTQNTIWLYEVATGNLTQVTSEMFDSSNPAFDRKGDWLYFTSTRTFNPTYSDVDGSFVYRDGEIIMALPLRADVKDPLAAKNDEEKAEDKDKKGDKDKKDAADKPAYAGAWSLTVKGLLPEGKDLDASLALKKGEGDAITGTAKADGKEHTVDSVAWDAATKTITVDVAADQKYTLVLTVDGDAIKGSWTAADGRTGTVEGKRDADAKEDAPAMKIDLGSPGDLERRAIRVPVGSSAFNSLAVTDSGKLLYIRNDKAGITGAGGGADLKIYDFLDDKADKKEEKSVLSNVDGYVISADGKKLLVRRDDALAVIDASADQKFDKKVPLDEMKAPIAQRDEWRQIFTEVWRLHRDFFYDAGLHHVDWKKVRERYEPLINDCVTRDDVTFVIAEMISELNVGHAYYRPGDADSGPPAVTVGMLGADYELVTQDGITAYRIKRIYEGGPWDTDARNPLRAQGIDVKEGQYILAVNGSPIDVSRDIWASFVGLAGQTISITVNDAPQMDDKARTVVVKAMESEGTIRFRAWIEDNRRYTDAKSGGKVGYIYVINTGVPGQNDLVRQFFGQRHKDALIIDDRWNGGGQIPTRFIEILNRPRTNYWARRDGKDWAWPRDSHQGPKAMLINGLSASGGDMFPALFRQMGLGKLFGTRTWGGLVGISGNPQCIDGTGTNVPTFGYYQVDGTWGIEGHGVDPDFPILDDPAKMPQGLAPSASVPAMGGDPQLDAAIDHLLGEIQSKGYHPPQKPAGPDRSGMGLPESDK